MQISKRPLAKCTGLFAIAAFAGLASHALADFTEGFESTMPGWEVKNASSPSSANTWATTNGAAEEVFGAHSGSRYAFADDTHTANHGTISSWLFFPVDVIKNGDTIRFWTRAKSESNFPDRLQLFLSSSGNSTDTGASDLTTGVFTKLLAEVNPTLAVGGFPDQDWQLFTLTIAGLNAPVNGRFGFRYFVTDGGSLGTNSDYIGLDDVRFRSTVPAPGALMTMLSAGALATRRRRSPTSQTSIDGRSK